jgi:hypothetical protein
VPDDAVVDAAPVLDVATDVVVAALPLSSPPQAGKMTATPKTAHKDANPRNLTVPPFLPLQAARSSQHWKCSPMRGT